MREWRERRSLTQGQLAALLGYTSPRQVNAYENGRAAIPLIVGWAMRGIDAALAAAAADAAPKPNGGPYAVLDGRAIWGVGGDPIAAWRDTAAAGIAMHAAAFQIVPITCRLRRAVEAEGGGVRFIRRPDGRLDLP